jgi:hypothetical protein
MTPLAASSFWYAVATAGGVVVAALLVNRFVLRRGLGRAAKSLGSLDPFEHPSLAITMVNASIDAGSIASVTDLVMWFRNGTAKSVNPKAITLPPPVVDALLPALLATFSTTQRDVWNRALVKHRWIKALDARRRTAFNESLPQDIELLRQLWTTSSLPGPFARKSESWNLLGFQGLDPATDFRGGGMLALDHFLSFATHHTAALKSMMAFNEGQLADGEPNWYLTAVVSIQLTVQLINEKDHTLKAPQLRTLFGEDESASATADKKVDINEEGVDGMQRLHHALFLHFRRNWERDLPHVMEYNTYMPKVFGSFFVDA